MPEIFLPALLAAGTEAIVAGSMAAFWTTFAVDAAIGAALYELAPKPRSLSSGSGPSTLTVKSSNESRKLVYGSPRIGGVLTFIESTNSNKYLHVVITFAAHEIDSFTTFYFDSEALVLSGNDVTSPSKFAGKVKVYPVTIGSLAAIPTNLLADTSWLATSTEEGQAYVYFRLEADQTAFAGGMPNISAVVKGRKVYDPRTGVTAYSDNATLCIRDYLMDSTYGIDAQLSEIDDTIMISAANVCDEAVALKSGGTELRYTLNGVVDTAVLPEGNIKAMLTSLAGSLYHSNGKWKIRAGAYVIPTVSLNEDDLAGPVQTQTAISAASNFNAVKGQFVGPATSYQPTDYKPITSAVFEAADGGFRKYTNLNLPYTNSSTMAQRIAKIVLYQNREAISIKAKYKLSAFKFDVGDTLMINDARRGFVNKPFVLTQWTLNFTDTDVSVDCVFRETNSSVYISNADEEAFFQDNTTLPDASFVAAPTGLTVTAGSVINNDGTVISNLIASWNAGLGGFVNRYEFQYKLTGAVDYTAVDGTSTGAVIQPVIVGSSYDIRVRAVNVFGIRSAWAIFTVSGSGDTTPPTTPTGISVTVGNKQVTIAWTNPAVSDFDHVNIYESSANISSGSAIIGSISGTSFTDTGLPNGTIRYYWLKSVDTTGNQSTFTTSVSATPTGFGSTDFSSSIKPVEIVAVLPASGTQGRVVFLTTDNQLYRDTGSAWTKAVATGDLTGTISAAQIAAGAVTSNTLAVNSVIAGKVAAGAISASEISVTSLSSVSATIGLLRTASTGERLEIASDVIRVYDAANVLRIKFGNLI